MRFEWLQCIGAITVGSVLVAGLPMLAQGTGAATDFIVGIAPFAILGGMITGLAFRPALRMFDWTKVSSLLFAIFTLLISAPVAGFLMGAVLMDGGLITRLRWGGSGIAYAFSYLAHFAATPLGLIAIAAHIALIHWVALRINGGRIQTHS